MWFPNVGGPEFSNKIKIKTIDKIYRKEKEKERSICLGWKRESSKRDEIFICFIDNKLENRTYPVI